MTTPFPGMDPYLEAPTLWPDVHNSLIAALRDRLAPLLRPRYYIRLEERTYLGETEGLDFIGRPDPNVLRDDGGRRYNEDKASGARAISVEVPVPDPILETYLIVRGAGNHEVVTVLEVLSPGNKRPGEGRRIYEEKRMEVIATRTNLVEVDLIRSGDPMLVIGAKGTSDYRILVSRGRRRPRADLYAFSVRDPIPTFALPLRSGDKEPEVDLGATLHGLYDRAAYDMSIDYRVDAVPPLAEPDRAWADDLLHAADLR